MLRGLAVLANVFILVSVVYSFFWMRRIEAVYLVVSSAVVLQAAISTFAMVSRVAENSIRWSALVLNVAAIAFGAYLLYENPSDYRMAGLILIAPALLNVVAVEALRRARARPA